MKKHINKITLVLSLCLLTSCTTIPKEPETPSYEEITLEKMDKHFFAATDFPLYLYNEEAELEQYLKSEPYDATKYQGSYQEFEDLTRFDYEIRVQNKGEWETLKADKFPEFYFPQRDGTYLLLLTIENQKTATLFTMGNGEYHETIDLEIFNPSYTYYHERIILKNDPSETKLYVYDFAKYFANNVVISRESNEQYFFNDFDFYVFDWDDETDYDMAEFRNGNEIHYNEEVYYIHEAYKGQPQIDILSATPTPFNEIINNETIQSIEVMYYKDGGHGEEPIVIPLNKEQTEYIINAYQSTLIYETAPLAVGAGSVYYYLRIATDKANYSFMDEAGPLVVSSDDSRKEYNAIVRIYDLVKEIGIEN